MILRKSLKEKIYGMLGSCEPYDEECLKRLQEHKVRVRVLDVQGECAAGHTVGDEIEITGPVITKNRICIWAYPLLHPVIVNKRFGLKMPYEKNDKVQCFSARSRFAEKMAEGVIVRTQWHGRPAGHRAAAEAIRDYLIDHGHVALRGDPEISDVSSHGSTPDGSSE